MNNFFRHLSTRTSQIMGNPYSFFIAIALIFIWLGTGPLFDFSNTWQLMVNTGTTIVTFLMVFLIQNTQNRDTKAIQIKLDELVKGSKGARNSFVNIEEVDDIELDRMQDEFKEMREHYEVKLQKIQEVRQKKSATKQQ